MVGWTGVAGIAGMTGMASLTNVKRVFALLGFSLLVGCAQISPEQRKELAQQLAVNAGWTEQVLQTTPFSLMAFFNHSPNPVKVVTIYLEGDGHAWVGGRYPSDDPTPLDPVALRLAMAQPNGAVAYLARPCQYLKQANAARCTETMWTKDRFSKAVVDSTNQGVSFIKNKWGAQQIVLVGYSGGARIALELAAQRDDIKQIITVAGNMDPTAWTLELGLKPLTVMQSNRKLILATKQVPQTYFIGDADNVIPSKLVKEFANQYPAHNRPRVIVIRDNAHVCCWVEQWPELWKTTSKP